MHIFLANVETMEAGTLTKVNYMKPKPSRVESLENAVTLRTFFSAMTINFIWITFGIGFTMMPHERKNK